MTEPSWIWRVPLAPMTRESATEAVMNLIQQRKPSYFITANVHYAMLTDHHRDLEAINRGAAFILADGAPLVWASRFRSVRLPERVAGSDLIYDLAEKAAERGHSIYLLGAAPGIADAAAQKLLDRYPGLRVAGTACPEPEDLVGAGCEALIARIRAAQPDLLLVALGQPKGERWIAEHCEALGVPACVQIGATLDFIAGRMKRSPRFYQKIGMEWAYRMCQEPKRLFPRYARNTLFIGKSVLRDLTGRRVQGPAGTPS